MKMKFNEVFQVIQKEPAVLIGIIISGVVSLFLGGFNLLVLSFGEIQASSRIMGWIYTV
jgi:MFS transporter, DHA3 family, macrolide efflux protein